MDKRLYKQSKGERMVKEGSRKDSIRKIEI